MNNEKFESLRVAGETLKNAREKTARSDTTIDACFNAITALLGSVFHQLRSVSVRGNSVTIHRPGLEFGDVIFKDGGTLAKNFQAAAFHIYNKAFEHTVQRIKQTTESLTTFHELFLMLAVVEDFVGVSMPVDLWEDACTAAVTIGDVKETGPAGIQVALLRKAILKTIGRYPGGQDRQNKA
jgi:hypothetical protein